jgi:hypothetical protein
MCSVLAAVSFPWQQNPVDWNMLDINLSRAGEDPVYISYKMGDGRLMV